MKTFKIILAILSVSFFAITNCEAQNWQWAKHFGGTSDDTGGPICQDQSGNIYLTGNFRTPSGIFGTDTINVDGYVDIFIVKFNSSGNFIWAKRAGGFETGTSQYDLGEAVLYESSSNTIIIAGTMDGTSQTMGTCNMGNSNKIFLSKLDLNGNCIWSSSYAPSSFSTVDITLDDIGNIYMTGKNTSPTTFNGISVAVGCFLAKFNSVNGSCEWAKKIMDSNNFLSNTKYFNNNLYLGGSCFKDTLSIDTATVYCHNYDMFISKLDTAGNVLWVKTMGGPNIDLGGNIELDGFGNIYTTGYFQDTAYFGSTMITNGIKKSWYLAKYNNNGILKWVKQANATSAIDYGEISSDHDGNVYTVGSFSDTVTFGAYMVTAATASDMFITRYDSSGVCLGVRQISNSIPGNVLSNSGFAYVVGNFNSSVSFGNTTLTSFGQQDVFLAKLDAITGIETKRALNNNTLVIYANPNKGTCNITVPDDLLHENNLVLNIYDSNGKLIQQLPVTIDQAKIKINLQEEATGVYNVTLGNKNKMYSGKIVFE